MIAAFVLILRLQL